MAYDIEIKEFAYRLFVKGVSFERIKNKVKKEYPEDSSSLVTDTIKRWKREENWDDRKADDQRLLRETYRTDRLSHSFEVLQGLREFVADGLDEVKDMNFSSKEGGMYAIKAANSEIRAITGESSAKVIHIKTEEESQFFIDLLNEIPELAAIMEKHNFYDRLEKGLENSRALKEKEMEAEMKEIKEESNE